MRRGEKTKPETHVGVALPWRRRRSRPGAHSGCKHKAHAHVRPLRARAAERSARRIKRAKGKGGGRGKKRAIVQSRGENAAGGSGERRRRRASLEFRLRRQGE